VEPGERRQIDDERAVDAQRAREIVVVPQRVVALRVREHRELAVPAEPEQAIDQARREERQRQLYEERRGLPIAGYAVGAGSLVEYIVPHILGAEPERGVVWAPLRDELGERLLDEIPRREVLARLLVRGRALLAHPQGRERIEHRDRGRSIRRAVVKAEQHVAVEIDVAHPRLAGCIARRRPAQHRVAARDPA
jgi:hypothetical protein